MTEEIKCQVCGSKTTLRTAKKGPNAGKKFYVCVKYPKCKGKTLQSNADKPKKIDQQPPIPVSVEHKDQPVNLVPSETYPAKDKSNTIKIWNDSNDPDGRERMNAFMERHGTFTMIVGFISIAAIVGFLYFFFTTVTPGEDPCKGLSGWEYEQCDWEYHNYDGGWDPR